MNRATLIGHVGKDPEIRVTQDGRKVASFSVATTEKWKDRNSGEAKERTEWHRIVCFNEGVCGIIEKFVQKGSKVLVEGAIKTRKWTDQSGTEKYTTEIVMGLFDAKLELLTSADRDGGSRQAASRSAAATTRSAPASDHTGPSKISWDKEASLPESFEDEIPF